jgi:ADP-heptose:LPS heptosyltransferase
MESKIHSLRGRDTAKPRSLAARVLRRLKAYAEPLGFLAGTVLPLWLKTGRRPVLFSRYMALGDVICAFPAALELKRRHPGAAVIFHCREDYACLVRLAGVTEHVASNLNIHMLETAYACLFARVYRFTYAGEDGRPASKESLIAEYCRQHGVPVTEEHPRFEPDPAVVRRVRARLQANHFADGPLVVIHPGPTWPVREWPLEAWTELVRALAKEGFTHVIQIGSGRPGAVGAALDRPIPGVWSLVNELSLDESVALVSLCQVFVGIESGLLHVAAALRVPGVGLFGPTLPESRYAPSSSVRGVLAPVECRGCHHRWPRLHWETGCPHDIACMKAITPAQVLAACRAAAGAAARGH